MTKFEMINQAREELCNATQIYCCARNHDNGLIQDNVKKHLYTAISLMDRQLNKYRNNGN